jgi:hypothetical protein
MQSMGNDRDHYDDQGGQSGLAESHLLSHLDWVTWRIFHPLQDQ